jgi:hypothetical protein
MAKLEPLGDPEKLKKGEQVMICRGTKFAGRNLFTFEDGQVAPMRIKTKRYQDLDDGELTQLNLKDKKTYKELLKEMQKEWPDFQEWELITLIFIDIEKKGDKEDVEPLASPKPK